MTGPDYRSVAARIRQELPELDRVVQRSCRAWTAASRDPEDLYSSLEVCIEAANRL